MLTSRLLCGMGLVAVGCSVAAGSAVDISPLDAAPLFSSPSIFLLPAPELGSPATRLNVSARAPPGDPSIDGLPPTLTINLLCQAFPTAADALTFETAGVYAVYRGLLAGVTIDIPPRFRPLQRVDVFLTGPSAGVFLAVDGPTCTVRLTPDRVVTLTWIATGGVFPGPINARSLSAVSDDPLPEEAFQACVRTVFLRVYTVPRPFSTSFSLTVAMYGKRDDLVVSASTAITARDLDCSGRFTYAVPPLALPAVPGTIDTSPFIVYTAPTCAAASTVAVYPRVRVPAPSLRDFVSGYDFICERLTRSDGSPAPPSERSCVVSTRAGVYPVFLTGHDLVVTDFPPDIGPVGVRWSTLAPHPFGYYSTCIATSPSAVYRLGLDLTTDSGGPYASSKLFGPAPAWAFQACLRSLYSDPIGMPGTVGTYTLSLVAWTGGRAPTGPTDSGLTFSSAVPRPFSVRVSCTDVPSGAPTPFFTYPRVTWRNARCAGSRAPLFSGTGFRIIPAVGDASLLNAVQVTCERDTCRSGVMLYFENGALRDDDPWKARVRWPTANTCTVSRAGAGPSEPPLYTLFFSNAFLIRPYTSRHFAITTPLHVTAERRVPAEPFTACLSDLNIVHNPAYGPAIPLSDVLEFRVTTLRNEVFGVTTRDASLTVVIPSSYDCSASVSTTASELTPTSLSSSSAKVIVPAVLGPLAAIALVAAAVVVARKRKAAKARAAPQANSQTGVEMAPSAPAAASVPVAPAPTAPPATPLSPVATSATV